MNTNNAHAAFVPALLVIAAVIASALGHDQAAALTMMIAALIYVFTASNRARA